MPPRDRRVGAGGRRWGLNKRVVRGLEVGSQSSFHYV